MTTASDPWGRVDENGTVYLRTAEGERAIGSWQAGDPEEALAFFRRKYDALATEVELLEQRLHTTDLSPSQAEASIKRLYGSVADANVIGDLDALRARLDALSELVEKRRDEVRVARHRAREEARETKEHIVAEAEQLAVETTHWKQGGIRFRELVEEWKAAGRVDRPTEAALWRRFSAARNTFTKRRKQYFHHLAREQEAVADRKGELAAEAESLADSTDWGPTSGRFRELMRSWKAAGRADRKAEEELWGRFKAAQDTFFQARAAALAARNSELQDNLARKEELLAAVEKLVPVRNPRSARSELRAIQEKWDSIGPVPRDLRDRVERRLRRVEEAVRSSEQDSWRRSNPEARSRAEDTIAQLKAAISGLETQLEEARGRGKERDIRDAEAALEARRSWLAEAERTLADLSGETV